MKINKNKNVLSSTKKTNITTLFISLSLIFFGLAIYTYSSKVIGGTITLFSIFLAISGLKQIFTKIILHPDRLEVMSIFNKISWEKESIQKVTWEKGGGVLIELSNDAWVTIPDLGNSQSVCNSLRSWLKKS